METVAGGGERPGRRRQGSRAAVTWELSDSGPSVPVPRDGTRGYGVRGICSRTLGPNVVCAMREMRPSPPRTWRPRPGGREDTMSWGEFRDRLVLGAEKGSPRGGAWAGEEEGAGPGLENSMDVGAACPSTAHAAVRGGSQGLFRIPCGPAGPAVGNSTWGAGSSPRSGFSWAGDVAASCLIWSPCLLPSERTELVHGGRTGLIGLSDHLQVTCSPNGAMKADDHGCLYSC